MKKRDEYIAVLHKKIDEWNNDIDTLKEKADKIDTESRIEIQQQIQLLKDIKSGMDLAWESMDFAVKSAINRFAK